MLSRTGKTIEIHYAPSFEEAVEYMKQGYCPVECSFGMKLGSVVDDLEMDHHGAFSHHPAVVVKSHEWPFGSREDDPRFVVTGDSI